MQIINLSNINKTILVDDENFKDLIKHSWCYGNGSISATIDGVNITIGRFILHLSKDNLYEVDHIDRNIFNNQKINLRVATRAQQNINKTYKNSSGYRGVTKHSDKWLAQITVNNKRKYLGLFFTKTDAAKEYNKAATKYFGEFAVLNKI